MKIIISFLAFFVGMTVCAQVGIGTTTPSPASALDINGTTNGSAPYKGFLPPRVPSQAERDMINATSIDVGLMVFVEDTGTMEIWNGAGWETIYTLSSQTTTLAFQDFDSNLTWTYTTPANPPFYNNPGANDFWGNVNSLNADADADIDFVSGFYLGCRDLNNGNGGGNFFHVLSFNNVNIASATNVRVAFDYDIFGFDGGDDVEYIVYQDDVAQPAVLLLDGANGAGGISSQGTETILIPGGVSNVRIDIRIIQNGDGDYAGFDNFRVYSL